MDIDDVGHISSRLRRSSATSSQFALGFDPVRTSSPELPPLRQTTVPRPDQKAVKHGVGE